MKLSEVTVKVHRHNLMKKLGAKSVPDLVRMAGRSWSHPAADRARPKLKFIVHYFIDGDLTRVE